MKIKVIYRNYIPLYSGYCSFWVKPIKNVKVLVPPVKKRQILFKIYRFIKNLKFLDWIINIGQKVFFSYPEEEEQSDMYFYAGLLPSIKNSKPFVVDFEHIHALFNYSTVDKKVKEYVWNIYILISA